MITMLSNELTQRVLARIAHLDLNEKMGVLYGLGLNPYWKSVMSQISSMTLSQDMKNIYLKEVVPDGTVLSSIKFGHYSASVLTPVVPLKYAPSYASLETMLFNHSLPTVSGSVTYDKASVDTYAVLLKLSSLTWDDFKLMGFDDLRLREQLISNSNQQDTAIVCSGAYRSGDYPTARRLFFIGDAIPSGMFKNFVRALMVAKRLSQNSNQFASLEPINMAFGYPSIRSNLAYTIMREGNYGLGFWFRDQNELATGYASSAPTPIVDWNPRSSAFLTRYSNYFNDVLKTIIPLRAELLGIEVGKDQMTQSWKTDMIEEIREMTSLNQNILSIGVTTREQIQIIKNNINAQISELEK